MGIFFEGKYKDTARAKAASSGSQQTQSGGRGIRTHETLLSTGFQDQLHRPLGQTSVGKFSR